MKIRKFAAIDIGSNAVRLLIQNVVEDTQREPQFIKNALVRVPVRLGEDTFTTGNITPANAERLVKTVKAFQLLMQVHSVEKYRACATSAMREAANGKEIVEMIGCKTGVSIEIIDGKSEATLIAATDLQLLLEKHKPYLYIDVGGGSTEFTVFSEGILTASTSFKIGTVRMLNETVEDSVWKEAKQWVEAHTEAHKNIAIIGSGGNINKLFKLSGHKIGQPLSYLWLNAQYQLLRGMTYQERILELGLNPDRADVIIPAAHIYLLAAKWSGAKEIHVPKIGLADGIIRGLYTAEASNPRS